MSSEIELEIAKGAIGFTQQGIKLRIHTKNNKTAMALFDYSLRQLDEVLKKSKEKEK